MNFFQGAFLEDPHTLFNAGLDAKKTRSIDFREGDAVDESALKELILERARSRYSYSDVVGLRPLFGTRGVTHPSPELR